LSIFETGNQPQQPGEGWLANSGSLVTTGLVGGGIAASGFLPLKKGRLFDKYINTIRTVETGFPSAILRTFRTSEFLSPLESWDKLSVGEEALKGGKYSEYLKGLFGESSSFELRKTGSIFGEVFDDSGRVVGLGLNIEAGSQKGTAIADYFARINGIHLTEHQSLNESLLRAHWRTLNPGIPFYDWLDSIQPHLRRERLILGAKLRDKVSFLGRSFDLNPLQQKQFAKLETLTNLLRAKSATSIGRLNTLLAAPFELPIVGEYLSKIPGIRSMAVKPGTSSQMIGRFVGKGILAGMAWKGLEYLDYLRSEGDPRVPFISAGAGALIGNLIAKQPGMKFSKMGVVLGAATGLMTAFSPRFDQGLFAGGLSLLTDTNVTRSEISESLGLTQALQRQEEVTPGLTKLSTGLAFGGVGMMAAGLGSYARFLTKAAQQSSSAPTFANVLENLREHTRTNFLNELWESPLGKKFSKIPGIGKISKIKSPMALGFLGGLATWGIAKTGLSLLSGNPIAALPGSSLIGTTETPEELQNIYSGRKEIAVRKGRFWEMGRSSKWEGGKIDYFRPHALVRLKHRAHEKGLWEDESERWNYDPLLNPLDFLFGDDEFKYRYELKHMYDRPAPLTAPLGRDIPFIGPLVSATFGKLLKPQKLIRPDEWLMGESPEGEIQYLHRPSTRPEEEPAYTLGGKGSGAPVAPSEPSQLFNEIMYRRREGIGLVGFLEGSMMKSSLGREEVFPNLKTLGSMGKETGSEYWLWKHLNLGGALFSSEAARRFIPRTRSYLEEYNPLRNKSLPSWIPEDYFMDLKYGDVTNIPEFEIRLPGTKGFEALHPELQGVNPEEYTLPWKVKVLGDLVMWSPAYRKHLSMAKQRMGEFSDYEQYLIRETERQVREKKVRKEFDDYTYNPDLLEEQQVTITKALSHKRFQTKEYGDLILEAQGVGALVNPEEARNFAQSLEGQKLTIYRPTMESRAYDMVTSGPRMKVVPTIDGQDLGSYLSEQGYTKPAGLENEFRQLRFSEAEQLAGGISEKLLHGVDTPLEQLTPISPASKLIRHRSPIESYVKDIAYGTSNAFWDRPLENFIKPTANLISQRMGRSEIPSEVKEQRDITEYFDMLKWVKNSRLERKARQEGNLRLANEFRKEKEATTFGADVFGNPTQLLKALPRAERDYFNAFTEAKSLEDREKILEMVPENERRIYSSLWARKEAQISKAKIAAKIATEQDDKILNATARLRMGEGFSFKDEQIEEWKLETGGKIPFDEWLREQKAEEYFLTHSLPGADHLIWNPQVDIDDIKMQYVEMTPFDFHDFNLWDARKRSMAKKPYINTAVIEAMKEGETYTNSWQVVRNSKELTEMYNDYEAVITQSKINANLGKDRYNIEVKDGRKDLIEKAYKQLGL